MFRIINPQTAPAAFLPYLPQELDLQRDLYGSDRSPVYAYEPFSAEAKGEPREHHAQFKFVIQVLQAWGTSHLDDVDEDEVCHNILAAYYERYIKCEFGSFTPKDYNDIKRELEAIALMLLKGPKPPGLKKALFLNLIQQIQHTVGHKICNEGMKSSQKHIRAQLEDRDCYENWLAHKRYEIIRKAAEDFIKQSYDPQEIRPGMTQHAINAVMIRAAALGYAPPIDAEALKEDQFVDDILEDHVNNIDHFLNEQFTQNYTLQVILDTVEAGFIKAIAAARAKYLQEQGYNTELHPDTNLPLVWEKWRRLQEQLVAKFKNSSCAEETDFCPEKMITHDDIYWASLRVEAADEKSDKLKLSLNLHDNESDPIAADEHARLLPMETFHSKIKPFLRRAVSRKIFNWDRILKEGILLEDGNVLILGATPEKSKIIITEDLSSLPYEHYAFQRNDRKNVEEAETIFASLAATEEILQLEEKREAVANRLQTELETLQPTKPTKPYSFFSLIESTNAFANQHHVPEAMGHFFYYTAGLYFVAALFIAQSIHYLCSLAYSAAKWLYNLPEVGRRKRQAAQEIDGIDQQIETKLQEYQERSAARRRLREAEAQALPAPTPERSPQGAEAGIPLSEVKQEVPPPRGAVIAAGFFAGSLRLEPPAAPQLAPVLPQIQPL